MKKIIFFLLVFFTPFVGSKLCKSAFNKGPAHNLFLAALNAQNNAYSPYSHFPVGAAILTNKGNVYCGCNVENSAFPSTQCAEATAVGNMVASGSVEEDIKEIVVVGKCSQGLCTPCGNCRQVLKEFANPKTQVHVYDPKEGYKETFNLSELLPESFGL